MYNQIYLFIWVCLPSPHILISKKLKTSRLVSLNVMGDINSEVEWFPLLLLCDLFVFNVATISWLLALSEIKTFDGGVEVPTTSKHTQKTHLRVH